MRLQPIILKPPSGSISQVEPVLGFSPISTEVKNEPMVENTTQEAMIGTEL